MLSNSSEYALRAVVALADTAAGSTLQARELARVTRVPASYLYKILTSLRRAGILAGSRGTRGGYCLARSPDEIALIDVVSLFEVVRPTDACVLGREICSDEEACSAHAEWKQVRNSYRAFLTSKTIADLAGGHRLIDRA